MMSSWSVFALSLVAAIFLSVLVNQGASAKVPELDGARADLFSRHVQRIPATSRPGYVGRSNQAAPSQTLRFAQSAVRYGTACITERGMCSVPRPVPVNTRCFCRTRGGMIAGRVLN
jgi:hypothetical protein